MQKITITLPLFTVEITGEHETDIFRPAALWQSLPVKCPLCGKPLILNYRTPKTYKYYELKCTGTPSHSVNLGESTTDHNLYFDPKKPWTTYQPNATETDRPATTTTKPTEVPADRNESGGKQHFGEAKNRLIKLITESKSAGIRTGLTPGDVGRMDESGIGNEIIRIERLLKINTE